MDFKRIEWIFLVVFIGINIFLGIELWQTPTLLSAGSTPTQTDIKSETRESKNTAYVASKDEAMFSAGSSDT